VVTDSSSRAASLLARRRAPDPLETLGLRERKKRQMRQHLSDTATGMFLERGFDQVRVSEVAAACGVSEKTVYNYFPTKESLLLDREDLMAETLRRALAAPGSATDAAVDALAEDLDELEDSVSAGAAGAVELMMIDRFGSMVEATPSLRAAQTDMMDRLLQIAAKALAERDGTDPESPENQIAANALMGLWRVQFKAMRRYADGKRTPAEVREAVLAEVLRAAQVVDEGLRQGLRQDRDRPRAARRSEHERAEDSATSS